MLEAIALILLYMLAYIAGYYLGMKIAELIVDYRTYKEFSHAV